MPHPHPPEPAEAPLLPSPTRAAGVAPICMAGGQPLQQLLDWPTDVWIQSRLEARFDLCGFKSFVAGSHWQLLTMMTTSKSSNSVRRELDLGCVDGKMDEGHNRRPLP